MVRLRSIDTLLLDFDGVLVDYHTNERIALSKILQDWQISEDLHDDAVLWYRGKNLELWEAFERDEMEMEDIRRIRFEELGSYLAQENVEPIKTNEQYISNFVRHASAYPGVIESLTYLRDHTDVSTIIVTNGDEEVQYQRSRITGIYDLVDGMVTSTGIGIPKPAPQIFDRALEIANSHYNRCWMVGDSLTSDIVGANNLNIGNTLIDHNNEHNFQDKTNDMQPDTITTSFENFIGRFKILKET